MSRRALADILPGLSLCLAVAAAALAAQTLQDIAFGRAYLDALVLAILLGMALRTAWLPPRLFVPGIALSATAILEIAVALLGASLSLQLVLAVGPALLVGIAAVVAVALLSGYAIGRALRLPARMALLVACGNAICGNSAIAAIAPIIGATAADVAASVTFTAALGVIVVLALPLLVPLLDLSEIQYGVVAGLTVYAVPQVLVATAPVGALAVQLGTFVKLVRVLLLGPVVVALSLVARRLAPPDGDAVAIAPARPPLSRILPWFIGGFLAMMTARSLGLIPAAALDPIATVSKSLTIVAMAALGLGVDVRTVARAGARVTAAVTLSWAVLVALSLGLLATGIVR